jgi:hypothetical protein
MAYAAIAAVIWIMHNLQFTMQVFGEK